MTSSAVTSPRITITSDGPYVVRGPVLLADQHIVVNDIGESIDYREGSRYPAKTTMQLCRCGKSATSPFCDGTHTKAGFDGTTTASEVPSIELAETFEGPTLSITDARPLCANARFCDPHGSIWSLVQQSDQPEARRLVVAQAGHCPSGRLIAWDRASGHSIEPTLPVSIGLIVDTARGLDGPIWVRGGIPVINERGTAYEVRNQCTLCRCGRSVNKPFCDGSHSG